MPNSPSAIEIVGVLVDPALSSSTHVKPGSTLQEAVFDHITTIHTKFNTNISPDSPIDIKSLRVFAGV